jgi:hypothetical protein
VDELPKIDELLRDAGFQFRLDEELRHTSVRLMPDRERMAMASLAALSFHPDGKIPAECREHRMTHLSKRLSADLVAMNRAEAWTAMDVDVVKAAVEQRRELKRQLDAAGELSRVKHLGVCWQASYLVALSHMIAKKTGWPRGRILKAVTELVAGVLHAANVQIWFEEARLRDLLRSAIEQFEGDPRHNSLMQKLIAR